MEYQSVQQAARRWQISERRVHQYCKEGRIPGLMRFGRSWVIPMDAEKPEDPRRRKESSQSESEAAKLAIVHGRAEKKTIEKAAEKPKAALAEKPAERTAEVPAEKPAQTSAEVTADQSVQGPEPFKNRRHQKGSKKVGALIAAAGIFNENGGVSPFMNLGTTSLIRRIVLIFQQAHISPIVVVTGYQALELEHHLSDYGVIFLHNENFEQSDKLASFQLGMGFLQNKCDKIFFTSVKIPMFMPDTLLNMMEEEAMIVIPQFQGVSGHPLLLDASVIPDFLAYQGEDGLRGAMRTCGCKRKLLEVKDKGVLLSTENIARLEDSLAEHNKSLLHPFVRLSIETDQIFFDGRAKLLLFLIQEFHSVQGACKQMAISRGKAWDMITRMEKTLGITLVQRQQGGSRERQTKLTREGEYFLQFFREYEESVKLYAKDEFEKQFSEFKRKLK